MSSVHPSFISSLCLLIFPYSSSSLKEHSYKSKKEGCPEQTLSDNHDQYKQLHRQQRSSMIQQEHTKQTYSICKHSGCCSDSAPKWNKWAKPLTVVRLVKPFFSFWVFIPLSKCTSNLFHIETEMLKHSIKFNEPITHHHSQWANRCYFKKNKTTQHTLYAESLQFFFFILLHLEVLRNSDLII